jgi:hypothetical protein
MTLEELREKYIDEKLEADWDSLMPKERIALYLGQMEEYFTPKRQRTSINQNDNELPGDIYINKKNVEWGDLTEEGKKQVSDDILNK